MAEEIKKEEEGTDKDPKPPVEDKGGDKESAPPVKKDGESEADFFARKAAEVANAAPTNNGEPKPDDKVTPPENKGDGKKETPNVARELRVEGLLGAVKDPNKRKLIQAELSGMTFGDSLDEVSKAFTKAQDVVEAPFLREVIRQRGKAHQNDESIAGDGATGSYHGGGGEGDDMNSEHKGIMSAYKTLKKEGKL